MQIGFVGLGRMGHNMSERLLRAGHSVVGYDRNAQSVHSLERLGASGVASLVELVATLAPPRVVWMMVPAGDATETTTEQLLSSLSRGDVLIDGANSNWKDSRRRAARAAAVGIQWLDAGTSGGIWGLENGYCFMIGGEKETYEHVRPVLDALAAPGGCAHVGEAGAGHYVKMIHNGIEYGLLQAYAEGFELLKTSPYEMDLHKIAALWNRGSVVRSWLLELAERAFAADPSLAAIRGYVDDSGTGRWTVDASVEQGVPAPVLALALQMRFRSRQDESFSAKTIAALRNQFGGHAVKKAGA